MNGVAGAHSLANGIVKNLTAISFLSVGVVTASSTLVTEQKSGFDSGRCNSLYQGRGFNSSLHVLNVTVFFFLSFLVKP